MVLTIRKATKDDSLALSRICLLTANAGKTSEDLHDFPELPGLVYAVPYVNLPTTWAFVLEHEACGVVGYVVGSTDTRTYEEYANAHWWPPLTIKYSAENAVKPADKQYMELFRNMHSASDASIDFSPAHLHINILPGYQHQGWGKKMIATAARFMIEQGVQGVWIGMDPRNESAKQFYQKLGFEHIEGADANHLGLRFEKNEWSRSA